MSNENLPLSNDPELQLLGEEFTTLGEDGFLAKREVQNAPIFTGDAFEIAGSEAFPQRAIYGRLLGSSDGGLGHSPKVYVNTNIPFSGVVCGVQVSLVSHSFFCADM